MKSLTLPILVLLIGGCVLEGPSDSQGPVPVSGNVNVLWRFSDGNTCGTLAGTVDHLQVDIPNQTLQGGGAFPCSINGTAGVELDDFAPGNYSIAVTAVDANGNPLYTWSGSFTVNGDVEVDALLVPVAPAVSAGNVTLLWSFTDGNTCPQLAGVVDHIQVTIAGQVLPNSGAFPCEANGTQGVEVDNFAPGDYDFTVEAVDSNGNPVYTFTGTFSVNGDVNVQVPLAPTGPVNNGTGTAELQWTFVDPQGGTHTCADVNVDTVAVTFSGYGTTSFPCDVNGVEGTEYDNLPTGSYTLTVAGLSNGTETFGLTEGVLIASGVNTIPLAMTAQ